MGNTFVEDSIILSDNELVTRICSGEYRYLEVLTLRYLPIIRKIAEKSRCNGCDTDDLIQEGTISLYSAVSSYKPGNASFHTFAVLCITRGIGNAAKRCRSQKHIPDRLICPIDETDVEDISSSPEKIVIDRENYRAFTDEIRLGLSRLEYNVLNEYLKGISYSDISRKLGISEKSVDNALKRIRRKLKK